MDLLRELSDHDFLLMLISEEQYTKQLPEIVKTVEASHTKICYVCLNKPYEEVAKDLKAKKIDLSRFFFIDVLSSHYKKPEPVKDCIFLSSPSNLDEIRTAIKDAMSNGCSAVIMDTISTLLIYQEASSIVKFTHNILTEGDKKVKKLFIVLKEEPVVDECKRLIDDLNMFADKQIDVGETS